ncbi:MAG: hypothetical protein KJO56_12645 [Gammaproteobacteria bacterium]|nr:hypothetical protein [Gammaproteobacteria bacterium]
MKKAGTRSGSLEERARQNTVQLAMWTAAWLITMALAVFGPTFLWTSKTLSLVAILVNLVVGAFMLIANKRHLDGLDELQRKIQIDAMALALGVGLVAGLAYSTADIVEVIAFDAEISYLVMLVSVVYLLGILLGRRRYQ